MRVPGVPTLLLAGSTSLLGGVALSDDSAGPGRAEILALRPSTRPVIVFEPVERRDLELGRPHAVTLRVSALHAFAPTDEVEMKVRVPDSSTIQRIESIRSRRSRSLEIPAIDTPNFRLTAAGETRMVVRMETGFRQSIVAFRSAPRLILKMRPESPDAEGHDEVSKARMFWRSYEDVIGMLEPSPTFLGSGSREVPEILASGVGHCLDYGRCLTKSLRALGFSTRIVFGIVIRDESAQSHAWIESDAAGGTVWIDPFFEDSGGVACLRTAPIYVKFSTIEDDAKIMSGFPLFADIHNFNLFADPSIAPSVYLTCAIRVE